MGTAVEKDRSEQIAALMSERDHREDCPSNRVEAYPETKPAKPDQGIAAAEVTVVHCCDCGNTKVLDETHEDLLERLEDELTAPDTHDGSGGFRPPDGNPT